ncbi:MAG TPA: acyltransferase family protein [Noviherbaspirillum sp.]|nr:acyltransferase family protein [Noviherbaspirillum sp.]
MNHPQRFHSLDNLRAIMMWLGIVLHVAVNHTAQQSLLPWHDRETSMVADLMLAFIHAFRMPVFFILAGFFAAMLVSRRGYGGMFKHRMRRIGLPLLLFWPLLFAGMGALAMAYVHLMVKGTLGIDESIMPVDPARPLINTMHLWFIYYLLWFCAVTALMGYVEKYLPDGFKESVSRTWFVLVSRWWGFLVLALPMAAIGLPYKWGIVVASGSFIPQFDEFVHNGLFFVAGLYVYQQRDAVLALSSKNAWRYALAGVALFMIYLVLSEMFRAAEESNRLVRFGLSLMYNFISWLWSFALIGIFMRHLPHQNRFLRYVSESSYWVYLVHMLGTIGFGIMLYNMPFNAVTKMGINILATTCAGIVTYHLLVRYTPISMLLNGHRLSFRSGQKIGKNVSVA